MAINKNLTGLIANILMDKYKKPVLLLNQTIHEDKSVWWEGSARGCNDSELEDFKELLITSGIEEKYEGYAQGHKNAFGFGI
jgi:single-stranded DNA-specific DHH superfamily exonuclease